MEKYDKEKQFSHLRLEPINELDYTISSVSVQKH